MSPIFRDLVSRSVDSPAVAAQALAVPSSAGGPIPPRPLGHRACAQDLRDGGHPLGTDHVLDGRRNRGAGARVTALAPPLGPVCAPPSRPCTSASPSGRTRRLNNDGRARKPNSGPALLGRRGIVHRAQGLRAPRNPHAWGTPRNSSRPQRRCDESELARASSTRRSGCSQRPSWVARPRSPTPTCHRHASAHSLPAPARRR